MELFELQIDASEKMIDITDLVKDYLSKVRFKKGLVHLQVPEKTSSLAILINDDRRMEGEFFKKINHLLPKYDGMMFTGWTTNSVKAALFGSNETLWVEEGSLILDLNQSLYFIEFHGPGKRRFFISTIGSCFSEDESAQMPGKLALLHKEREKMKIEEARTIEKMREEWRAENQTKDDQ